MDRVYDRIIQKFVVVYLDDTIIFSKTFDDYLRYLREVFTRIRYAGLRLNIEKYNFWMQRLPFLGYIIALSRITPDLQKIEAVQKI